MNDTVFEPSRDPLLNRLHVLFVHIERLHNKYPLNLDLHDAKVLTQSMLLAGRANFDLMELVVSHLDTAQVWYPEEGILYSMQIPIDCAAHEIFADLPIPYIAIDPPPLPSTEEFFVSDDFRDIETAYTGDGFTEEYEYDTDESEQGHSFGGSR